MEKNFFETNGMPDVNFEVLSAKANLRSKLRAALTPGRNQKKLIFAMVIFYLGGCQPDTPAQQTAAPAPVAPAPAPAPAPATPVLAEKPAEVAMTPAPAANDPLVLAKKYGCLACHAIGKKMVGPAWQEVAAKYRGDAGAEDGLMEKVAKGGSGVWGKVAMPPNPKPSEAERRELVKFILSLN